ncbi:MAG: N-acetylmuramoyl-L-alanine amidase [Spirochaetia bacterium]|nr:N-acetylmuramoyl-L-alanine amidase [Spirochaetota bacterium]MCX8096052.1 N-acetylmuramoyl-L-alanine amidase [Spirochaetota bacterium]MDW8113242.1 N-acetylmuramoyl-L-alanine amidase [Spirochaetia bacterium]
MFLRLLFIILLVFGTFSPSFSNTFYLTNNVIEIFSFAETLKGKLEYDPYRSKIVVRFSTNVIEFFEDREFYILNSNFVMPFLGGLIRSNYNYYLPLSVVDSIVSFLKIECRIINFSTARTQQSSSTTIENTNRVSTQTNFRTDMTTLSEIPTNFTPIKFIIIDAGHGGKDPGAIHNGFKEKELNLTYARAIAAELTSILHQRGIDIVLTRNSDTYLTLEQRVKIANNLLKRTQGYGIFISVHQNASPIKSKRGFEIYYVSDQAVDDNAREVLVFENSFIPKEEVRQVSELEKVIGKIRSVALMEESRILSENISRSMNTFSPVVKGAPFYVIKYIPIPSILLEIGYISNPDESRIISSKEYISSFAKSLANGIDKFIEEYNQTRGFTMPR